MKNAFCYRLALLIPLGLTAVEKESKPLDLRPIRECVDTLLKERIEHAQTHPTQPIPATKSIAELHKQIRTRLIKNIKNFTYIDPSGIQFAFTTAIETYQSQLADFPDSITKDYMRQLQVELAKLRPSLETWKGK